MELEDWVRDNFAVIFWQIVCPRYSVSSNHYFIIVVAVSVDIFWPMLTWGSWHNGDISSAHGSSVIMTVRDCQLSVVMSEPEPECYQCYTAGTLAQPASVTRVRLETQVLASATQTNYYGTLTGYTGVCPTHSWILILEVWESRHFQQLLVLYQIVAIQTLAKYWSCIVNCGWIRFFCIFVMDTSCNNWR